MRELVAVAIAVRTRLRETKTTRPPFRAGLSARMGSEMMVQCRDLLETEEVIAIPLIQLRSFFTTDFSAVTPSGPS